MAEVGMAGKSQWQGRSKELSLSQPEGADLSECFNFLQYRDGKERFQVYMALIFLRKNKETLSAINSDGKQLTLQLTDEKW